MKVIAKRIKAYRENLNGSRTPGTARVLTGAYDDTFVRVDDFRDMAGQPLHKRVGEKLFLVYQRADR